ncbi:hypothetical protein COF68_04480 [Bacillus toyonensis]|uniref:hypothetical protein n=1 Tax=Bacillus toyonensis TaxID=155322 RepID=UPI000BFDC26E|nr:hypothetical protein [Bacillus toyonensis]PHE64112.1 hypothetical protein COF68_04480 [Bacillus toyonensis]
MKKTLLIAFVLLIGVVGVGSYYFTTIDKKAFEKGTPITAEVVHISSESNREVDLEVEGEKITAKVNKDKYKDLSVGAKIKAVKYKNSYHIDPDYK